MANLLLDERAVVVQPSLVRVMASMSSAAVLQQIHWHAQNGRAHVLDDGFAWVPITYDQLSDETGLNADQARRAVERLEAEGVVLSCQPEQFNRRKSYRIDYSHRILAGASAPSGKYASSEAAPVPDAPSSKSSKTQRSRAGDDVPRGTSRRKRASEEAGAITSEWWEWCVPRPLGAHTFVAVRGMVQEALDKGWEAEEILGALKACPRPIVKWRLEEALQRVRQERTPRNPAASRWWDNS